MCPDTQGGGILQWFEFPSEFYLPRRLRLVVVPPAGVTGTCPVEFCAAFYSVGVVKMARDDSGQLGWKMNKLSRISCDATPSVVERKTPERRQDSVFRSPPRPSQISIVGARRALVNVTYLPCRPLHRSGNGGKKKKKKN